MILLAMILEVLFFSLYEYKIMKKNKKKHLLLLVHYPHFQKEAQPTPPFIIWTRKNIQQTLFSNSYSSVTNIREKTDAK
jgi:hypothetical protein